MRRFCSSNIRLARPWVAVLGLFAAQAALADQPLSINLFTYDRVAEDSGGGVETPALVEVEGDRLSASQGRSVRIRLDKNLDGSYEVNRRVFTGILDLPIADPFGTAAIRQDTFCVEIDRTLSRSDRNYQRYEAFGQVGWLLAQVAPNRANKDLMAGLQVAIWELVYDDINGNAANLGGGIFSISSDTSSMIRNAALSFLGASEGKSAAYFYLRDPVPGQSGNSQDLILIPEPATLVVLAMGSLLLRRRPSETWRLAA